ncbi:MAG: hypothetical protein OSA98_02565 [Rubripirellula sp.]|nr:hypothetical protein [Rubripirellula sp.]
MKTICIQNHNPWEHSAEKELELCEQGRRKSLCFPHLGIDGNAKNLFAELAIDADSIHWFAGSSCKAINSKQ